MSHYRILQKEISIQPGKISPTCYFFTDLQLTDLVKMFDRIIVSRLGTTVAHSTDRSRLRSMATIWFVKEGLPVKGTPVAEQPFQWCVDELGLHRDLCLPTRSETLILERRANDPGAVGNPRRIFVELKDQEATRFSDKGWRSGYYLVVISVSAVKNKMEEQLGHPNTTGEIRAAD